MSTLSWSHICDDSGVEVYSPVSWKFCPYCGISNGETKLDTKHPPIHWEWIDGFRVFDKDGYRTYRRDDVAILIRQHPNYGAQRARNTFAPDEQPEEEFYGRREHHEHWNATDGGSRPPTPNVEWDIDRNLPVYVKDLLKFAERWTPDGEHTLRELIERFANDLGRKD